MHNNGVAIPGSIAVLLGTINRINGNCQRTLLCKVRHVSGRFFALNATGTQYGVSIAECGDQQFLDRQIRERQRIGVGIARRFAIDGDVELPKSFRHRSAPAHNGRQCQLQSLDDFVCVHVLLFNGSDLGERRIRPSPS